MEIFDYLGQSLPANGRIFPAEINESPWVLFHGTTNVSEDNIEKEGLNWQPVIYNKDDVVKVVNIFVEMDWYGLGGDSVGALYNYSLSCDFREGWSKATYLHDNAELCVGYAQQRGVGGETAGLLRYAISNLEEFLRNNEVREKYLLSRYRRILRYVKGAADVPKSLRKISPQKATAQDCMRLLDFCRDRYDIQVIPELHGVSGIDRYVPWDIDLEWLRAKLEELDELKRALNSELEKFKYGVIYAIELGANDLLKIKDLNSVLLNGYEYSDLIHPSMLKAKATLGPQIAQLMSSNWNPGHSREQVLKRKNGILSQVADYSGDEDVDVIWG